MVEAGTILRVQANSPFVLHWTKDDWQRSTDRPSRPTAVGVDYADIVVPNGAAWLQFTFLWVDEDRWEGKDYDVRVTATVSDPMIAIPVL
jgi:glucoamylase